MNNDTIHLIEDLTNPSRKVWEEKHEKQIKDLFKKIRCAQTVIIFQTPFKSIIIPQKEKR